MTDYNVRTGGYGVVYIEPAIDDATKAKIQSLSRSDLTIEAIEPKLEFAGGNSFHYAYGTPKNPRATSVLLALGQWEKAEELAAEIKAVI